MKSKNEELFMFSKLVLSVVLLCSAVSFAGTSAVVLQNGSVARCSEGGDQSHRAYRLKVLSSDESKIVLQLDTLMCVKDNDKILLIPAALANKQVFHNDKDIITYEMSNSSIQVTNIEGTQELARVAIDTKLASQTVVINTANMDLKAIDLTIQSLLVIKINNKHSDQGMVFGGNYRIIKQ